MIEEGHDATYDVMVAPIMQGKSQASVVSLSAGARPIVVGAGHASDALDPGPKSWDGSCSCINRAYCVTLG
jgi:hypothetical protein